MSDVGEDGLLSVCPWCQYALKGLPVEHVCPECGESFDRRWRMYDYGDPLPPVGAVRFWYRLVVGILACYWVIYGLFRFVTSWIGLKSLTDADALVFPLFALILIRLIARRLLHGRAQFLLITQKGIVLRDRLDPSQRIIPWIEIRDAMRTFTGVLVELKEEKVKFSSMRRADDCLEQIEKWRDLHGAE